MKNMRGLVKVAVANTFHRLSLDKMVGDRSGATSRPLVICYHRVVQDFQDCASRAMPSLLVSAAMFEKQLDWLATQFDMVSLDDILGESRSGNSRGRRQATVSFDDGYADFLWNAVPILQKKGIPSSVFVVTDLVGTPNLQTHDQLYLLMSQWYGKASHAHDASFDSLSTKVESALRMHSDPYTAARHLLAVFSQQELREVMLQLTERLNLPAQSFEEFKSLNWNELRMLTAQGITVGSHTCSHALLPHHEQRKLIKELLDSRQKLESELDMKAKYLAYPDGQFDERTARAAQAAGYEAALTICDHISQERPLYSMPRQVLWENACIDTSGNFSPAIMGCLVNGVFKRASRCTQDHTVS